MPTTCRGLLFSILFFPFLVTSSPAEISPAEQPMDVSSPESVTPLLVAPVGPVRVHARGAIGWGSNSGNIAPVYVLVASATPGKPDSDKVSSDSDAEETPVAVIADPFEPLGRVAFQINDKLYFWALKPVTQAYKAVVPEPLRIGVRNFFYNLTGPVRIGNCLLQARFRCVGTETAGFLLNSTVGLAGFLDAAKDAKLQKEFADFGQTLGVWGFTPGFYIHWLYFGPSSLRETFGFVGDLGLDPRTYLFKEAVFILLKPAELVSDASFRIGDYEDLKEAALDPYVALKDAYLQYRENKVKQVRK